ncbi:MAG: hypothetical protein D6685_02370 [Bacteroidetes bacterium]|nr:MAG: hypothetical protein D6685_02370 [Bacteroidota bacterium]
MGSNPWDLDVNLHAVVLDFMFLGTFLLVGTALRRYVRLFQRYLIPNALIGGFAALLVSTQGLGWVDMPSDRLGLYVYHLLALTFVALGLRKQKNRWGKGPLSKALASLASLLVQAIVGLIVAFVLVYTLYPNLFVGTGLMVPLGFGMGPGMAYSIGRNWEQFGFAGGGQVGLTFAVIGYLFAFIGGMALVNWGIRTRRSALIDEGDEVSEDVRIGVYKTTPPPVAGYLPLSSEAIEPMAFQFALIGFVYLLTYGALWLLGTALTAAGLGGFVSTFWSLHFILALLMALAVRAVLDRTGRAYLIDSGLMTRTMGVFLDFLIVAAVAAISFVVVQAYWLPILLMSILAGAATIGLLYWLCWRAFDDYHFERFVELFGEMTGTINSAIILLRVTDPEFKTPVAEDAAYGSGISFFAGLPLIFMLQMPFLYFQNRVEGYWLMLLGFTVYLVLLLAVWRWIGFLDLKGPGRK